VEKRYGKNARAEVFLMATLLIVLILGSVVAIQLGETDVQRKARIQANEAYIVRIACKLGERTCSFAKEDARRITCHLFPEECDAKK
jgi:hypothetical protein